MSVAAGEDVRTDAAFISAIMPAGTGRRWESEMNGVTMRATATEYPLPTGDEGEERITRTAP